MWTCPVCGFKNKDALICPTCGFDETQNITKYLSLIKLPQEILKQSQLLQSNSMLSVDTSFLNNPALFQLMPKPSTIVDIAYITKHPLNYFMAYGLVNRPSMLLKPEQLSEDDIEKIRLGGIKLYKDLRFLYCCNLSDKGNFKLTEKIFSSKYNDGYDDYRFLMLGLLYWRTASIDNNHAQKAIEIFKQAASDGCILGAAWAMEAEKTDSSMTIKNECTTDCSFSDFKKIEDLARLNNAEAQYFMGTEAYIEGDYKKAGEWFSMAYANLCMPAGIYLGDLYYWGNDVDKDSELAYNYYKISERNDSGNVLKRLGDCAYYGEGAVQNEKLAYNYYVRSAQKLNISAMKQIGAMMMRGKGCEKNEKEGFSWILQAAKAGDAQSQYLTGLYYDNGVGIEQNRSEALHWYEKSCEQGYPSAYCALGYAYYTGNGIVKDEIYALELWRDGIKKGDQKSAGMAAKIFYENYTKAVTAGHYTPELLEEALNFAQIAVSSDSASVDDYLLLGYIYQAQMSLFGIDTDESLKKAELAFRKACQLAVSDEEIRTSALCLAGVLSAKVIGSEYIEVLKKAASVPGGDGQAEYLLGSCYEYGFGVKKDKKTMKEWMEKASQKGNEKAKAKTSKWWF